MINKSNTKKIYILFLFLLGLYSACKYDTIPMPPGPVVPKATDTLNAVYVKTSPNSISSSYWSTANYHPVTCADLSTGQLYGDGLLNMTGTHNGNSSFNQGNPPDLIMKAAYDSENLYILLQWNDNSLNLSNSSWLYNGPADPLKSDTTGGWTSQRNNDKVSLEFEIQPASGQAGTFSSIGCGASCHGNQMELTSGSVDIWNWNLALSEPLGLAGDMVLSAGSGLSYDSGQVMFVRNLAGSTNRSGPAYSWNGAVQTITRGNGTTSILDPAYYLVNKTPFTGNVANGNIAFHNITYGCFNCHGDNGEGNGQFENGASFRTPNINRYSWSNFVAFVSGSTSAPHDGSTYWAQMSASQQADVYAYILGFAGVPGYYLQQPSGSNTDIISSSDVNLVNVNATTNTQYKVLLIRKLNTGHTDDVVFTPAQKATYVFGVALMDNDGINHIGSLKETLQFLKK